MVPMQLIGRSRDRIINAMFLCMLYVLVITISRVVGVPVEPVFKRAFLIGRFVPNAPQCHDLNYS